MGRLAGGYGCGSTSRTPFLGGQGTRSTDILQGLRLLGKESLPPQGSLPGDGRPKLEPGSSPEKEEAGLDIASGLAFD